LIAVPSNPNVRRIVFSMNRRKLKCASDASFRNSTKVGGRTSACVA